MENLTLFLKLRGFALCFHDKRLVWLQMHVINSSDVYCGVRAFRGRGEWAGFGATCRRMRLIADFVGGLLWSATILRAS